MIAARPDPGRPDRPSCADRPLSSPARPLSSPSRAWLGGLALAIGLSPAAACDGGGRVAASEGLDRERFIEVIVELREAERSVAGEDSARALFERRRAEILERHGTSEAEVRTFVEASARDLRTLTSTWEEIADRLRRPSAEDSAEVF